MKLQFWGATNDVTGSMTFVHLDSGIVMVDCGLTQGPKETEALNLLTLPVDPKMIKAVIITHAHLDHSGYLPRLVKTGFRGPIYCTPPTSRLIKIILQDSAKLNEESFYGEEDVRKTINLIQTKDWHTNFEELEANITFMPAGHILGASSVKINIKEKTIVFSGDLGRFDDPILPTPELCPEADLIVMESTYGGRNRSGSLEKDLERFLTTVARESRVGIIASFAVARGQMLQTLIAEFYERNPGEKVRVCVDSPMMAEANKVYRKYSNLTLQPESVYTALDQFDLIEFPKEWDSLSKKSGPLIVITSSGMLTGGRINRYLYNWREDDKAILFLPGYQGKGTPGRSLKEGSRQLVGPNDKIFTWKGEVWTSEEFSSHADQDELLRWVRPENNKAHVYLLHGESKSKSDLKDKLMESGFSSVTIPERGEIIEYENI